MNIKPVIKWSGSKRSQAEKIADLSPSSFSTYFEPFIGGGSMLYTFAPRHAVCGDICKPLIDLWNQIKDSPQCLAKSYRVNWNRLQNEGHEVFYEIRDYFNKHQDPESLLFLSRTCVNGLIRFNKSGEFNNSLHHTRPGIHPDRLDLIISDWSNRIQGATFTNSDYRETAANAERGDFVYLDPPYFNTKGRYYGGIDFGEFTQFLESLNAKGVHYALSYDGVRGDTDYTAPLPKELYRHKIMIPSGNSSFKKLQDKKNELVYESLYLNY